MSQAADIEVGQGPTAEGPGAGAHEYDVIIVGSGFGGSVAALRLAEKGYRVAVLEAGRRFEPDQLPKSSWDVRRFLWAPRLGCLGIQRAHFLRDVVVLAGAGVGGGSLNYANTLYEPPQSFYDDPQWAAITDWRAELAPFYDQAARMLGVAQNPTMTPADEAMKEVAVQMGAANSFRLAPVGVFFGPPGTPPGTAVADPYFGGAGPSRRACRQCGECMTGCRHGAKNTLLTNYLYLAEKAGAIVLPLTTVTGLEPGGRGAWRVRTRPTPGAGRVAPDGRTPRASQPRDLTAPQVILAAGTWGTQQLLHAMVLDGRLPNLSPRLGWLTRTNSESLLGAVVPRRQARADFSQGVAITSSFYPSPETHVEPVRYGRRSNLMGLLGTVLMDRGAEAPGPGPGRARGLMTVARHPWQALSSLDLRHWSERTVIALVMQARDNSLVLSAKRGLWGRPRLTSRQGHGEPNPSWLPEGHDVVRRLARVIGGRAAGNWGEILGMPITAHFLGGCVIGAHPAEGVIDPWHRVYGHSGLHIIDGSAVPANPGVNPSLTITALAERALAYWPNQGDDDHRPPLGQVGGGFSAPVPVPPSRPAVPAGAPGELRFGPSGAGPQRGQA